VRLLLVFFLLQRFGELLIYEELPRVLDEFDVMSWKACIHGLMEGIAADLPA